MKWPHCGRGTERQPQLTARETQVIDAMRSGIHAEDIPDQFGITPATVQLRVNGSGTTGNSLPVSTETGQREKMMLKYTLIFLSLTCAALSQNLRHDSVAYGPNGPIPNAFVAVCSQPANTTTQPCSPLANLCSSFSDTTCTQPNPLTTDGLGNFYFYLKGNTVPFTVQIYGPQVIVPYVLSDQGLSGYSGGVSIPVEAFGVPTTRRFQRKQTKPGLGCVRLLTDDQFGFVRRDYGAPHARRMQPRGSRTLLSPTRLHFIASGIITRRNASR